LFIRDIWNTYLMHFFLMFKFSYCYIISDLSVFFYYYLVFKWDIIFHLPIEFAYFIYLIKNCVKENVALSNVTLLC